MLTVDEMETGLFLDLKLQKWLEKLFSAPATQMSVIDSVHAADFLFLFEHIVYVNSPLNTRTIIIDEGTVEYKVTFYNDKTLNFVKIALLNQIEFMYVILQRDINKWNSELSNVKKTYYF